MTKQKWQKITDFILYAKHHLLDFDLPASTRDKLVEKMDDAVDALEEETGHELRW